VHAPLRDAAEARAAALLLEHLTPAQAREYEETGSVSIVKTGLIGPVLRRHLLLAGLAATAAIALAASGDRVAVGFTPLPAILTLLPLFAPSFLIACSRSRTWRIDAMSGPRLLVGRRRMYFCVRIDQALPSADRILAYKNILEANEAYFLRKANGRF
jgi:hypothetical protein